MAAEAGGGGGGGGGGDRPVGWSWDKLWKDGNDNQTLPAPAQRQANKAKLSRLLETPPTGVDEKELTRYKYQASTGNKKLDKARACLVDDYNAIVDKRLKIYKRMHGASSAAIKEEIKEVMKMASQARKRYEQLVAERSQPHTYPPHFDHPPKFKNN